MCLKVNQMHSECKDSPRNVCVCPFSGFTPKCKGLLLGHSHPFKVSCNSTWFISNQTNQAVKEQMAENITYLSAEAIHELLTVNLKAFWRVFLMWVNKGGRLITRPSTQFSSSAQSLFNLINTAVSFLYFWISLLTYCSWQLFWQKIVS